jgi:hypothetical protein
VNVYSLPSFDRALKNLSAPEQSEVLRVARQLPEAFGKPHVHAGLGIRRIGPFFEFRVGLKLRAVFRLNKGDAFLTTVGNHDAIRRWVKDNF